MKMLFFIWHASIFQDEREEALAELKAIQQKYTELKVGKYLASL